MATKIGNSDEFPVFYQSIFSILIRELFSFVSCMQQLSQLGCKSIMQVLGQQVSEPGGLIA